MRALNDHDRERITELAELGQSAKRIGAALGKHPSTVQWFMYTTGLRAPSYATHGGFHMRGGRRVHRFTPEEDRFIEGLRIDGVPLRQIAQHASERFDTQRTHHTIRCRLVMLAARDEEETA